MASLTIKGVPEELLQRLRDSAARHRRSLNSEVLYRLERSVEARHLDPEALLARIEARRAHSSLPP